MFIWGKVSDDVLEMSVVIDVYVAQETQFWAYTTHNSDNKPRQQCHNNKIKWGVPAFNHYKLNPPQAKAHVEVIEMLAEWKR